MRPPDGRPVTPKPFVQSVSARTAVVVEFGDQMKSVAASVDEAAFVMNIRGFVTYELDAPNAGYAD